MPVMPISLSPRIKPISVNQTGVMFTMRAAAAVMKRQASGRIVVTASNAGLRPEPLVCYGYAASKAAVIHMVRHAALDLASHGILVNAICPGPFYGTLIGGGVTENPTEEMKQQIVQHMQQILAKTGQKAPPLGPGAMPPGQVPPLGGTGK